MHGLCWRPRPLSPCRAPPWRRTPTIPRTSRWSSAPTSAWRPGWCAAPPGPEGFGVDMIKEVAKRIGRPGVEIVDINFSGLFAALFSKRIEFTVNPLNITAERAERMLYTEPFFATGNGFLIRAADDHEGLRGSQGQAARGEPRHHLRHLGDGRMPRNTASRSSATTPSPNSVQAVITRRAFTALNEIPTTVYAASQNKAIKVGFKDYQRPQLRLRLPAREHGLPQHGRGGDRMHEEATARSRSMYEKWYGSQPDAASSINTVFPGYGPPGFKGYDLDAARGGLPRLRRPEASSAVEGPGFAERGLDYASLLSDDGVSFEPLREFLPRAGPGPVCVVDPGRVLAHRRSGAADHRRSACWPASRWPSCARSCAFARPTSPSPSSSTSSARCRSSSSSSFLYFGLPYAGIQLSPFGATVIALGAVLAAFATEIFWAAIQAVPAGPVGCRSLRWG